MLSRFWRRPRSRGQSLAEFALVLPLMLLLLLFGIDFGRVFLGWVELNNVVREAANFAAQNPTAWSSVAGDATAQAQYVTLVKSDAAGIDCALPNPLPTPAFPDGPNNPNGLNSVGQPVTVGITCNFSLITPIIGNIIGNPLHVSSSAAFPIRYGAIAGIPVQDVVQVTSTTSSTTSATTTSTITTTTTTTLQDCPVPDLSKDKTQQVAADWVKANFTQPVAFSPLNPPNGSDVTGQSLTAGTMVPCGSTGMVVTWK